MSAGTVNMAVCQFFGLGFANFEHSTAEMQVETGQGVIEVHFYRIGTQTNDFATVLVAFFVLEVKEFADAHVFAIEFSGLIGENSIWNVHDSFRFHGAISINHLYSEIECFTTFEADEGVFKFERQAAVANQEIKWIGFIGAFHQSALGGSVAYMQVETKSDYFFRGNYHDVILRACKIAIRQQLTGQKVCWQLAFYLLDFQHRGIHFKFLLRLFVRP